MRFDMTPLYRSTVGFDRLFSALDHLSGADVPAYPPYNIEKTGESAYRVTIAVAGFAESDLTVEVRENALTVKGERKAANGAPPREVLFQGIAGRAFERRFQLADHVIVQGATLENGLLHVDLVREVPEAKKPRLIAIREAAPAPAAKVIEAPLAA
jgi:molecular chaperone IbpA